MRDTFSYGIVTQLSCSSHSLCISLQHPYSLQKHIGTGKFHDYTAFTQGIKHAISAFRPGRHWLLMEAFGQAWELVKNQKSSHLRTYLDLWSACLQSHGLQSGYGSTKCTSSLPCRIMEVIGFEKFS